MEAKEKCSKCGKEIIYHEKQDKENNEIAPLKIRKFVVDSDNNMAPLYAIPKDKQRLVDEKFIKFLCSNCAQ